MSEILKLFVGAALALSRTTPVSGKYKCLHKNKNNRKISRGQKASKTVFYQITLEML